MKTYRNILVTGLLSLLPLAWAKAQFHGHLIYGSAQPTQGVALGTRPGGNTLVGMIAPSYEPSGRELPAIGEEDGAGPGLSFPYKNLELNGSTGAITGISNHRGTDDNAVVGFFRMFSQSHNDGFFLDHVNSIGQECTAVYWTGDGDEIPMEVLELADHSFVVVGSREVGGTAMSFVTRLKARPDYGTIYTKQVGDLGNIGETIDQAVAVAQLADGSLLIAGNTGHFSGAAEGSPYLMKMGLDGGMQSFQVYDIASPVRRPRVTDMTVLNNGTIVLVGTTLIPNGADSYMFVMEVTSNLLTANFQELIRTNQGNLGHQLLGVAAVPGTNTYYASGYLERQDAISIERNPILLRFQAGINADLIRRMHTVTVGNEQYHEVEVHDNGQTVQAMGTTYQVVPGSNANPGRNALSTKLNTTLDACNDLSQTMEFHARTVTRQSIAAQASSVNCTVIGTLGIHVVGSPGAALCSSAKMDLEEPTEADEAGDVVGEPKLYPNPAGGYVTLELPGLKGVATVRVCDAQGRVLLERQQSDYSGRLELGGIAPGLLLVQVRHAGREFTQKLIHQ